MYNNKWQIDARVCVITQYHWLTIAYNSEAITISIFSFSMPINLHNVPLKYSILVVRGIFCVLSKCPWICHTNANLTGAHCEFFRSAARNREYFLFVIYAESLAHVRDTSRRMISSCSFIARAVSRAFWDRTTGDDRTKDFRATWCNLHPVPAYVTQKFRGKATCLNVFEKWRCGTEKWHAPFLHAICISR